MGSANFSAAVEKLKEQYLSHDWTYYDVELEGKRERMFRWPGKADEDIIVVVHQSAGMQEKFHYHDYFYFNYTYSGSYESLSYKYDNKIRIEEGELYAGQPFAGHALFAHDDQDVTIIGVLIRKEFFHSNFLQVFSPDTKLFRFLLDPVADSFADEFIRLKAQDSPITDIIELMAVEYAFPHSDTPQMLKSLATAYLLAVARLCKSDDSHEPESSMKLSAITSFIRENSDTVTLQCLSEKFAYHPNYISAILSKETGKPFSRIVLEERMKKAALLIKGTELPVTEVAQLVGYNNSSNFYKAFKNYYGTSPQGLRRKE